MMVIANIVLLNLLWFASVLGAANGLIWPAAMVLVLLLGFNFIYAGISQLDYKIIGFSVCAGLLIDGVMMHQGWVIYAYKQPDLGLIPPLWIMMLWVGFGASIRHGMQWLLSNPVVGGLIMLIGAPLSYVSAGKLGATVMPDLWQAMIFIGVSWLIYFMLIVHLTQNKEAANVLA